MGRVGVPASSIPSILLLTFDAPGTPPPSIHSDPRSQGIVAKSYLSRVDPLARENVVVGAHLERLLLAVANFFPGVVDVAWWSAVGVGGKRVFVEGNHEIVHQAIGVVDGEDVTYFGGGCRLNDSWSVVD
jgi:hypothetical protein